MKIKAIGLVLISMMISTQLSCSKEKLVKNPVPVRTIRFVLYAKKDFSDNKENITFSLFIRNQKRVLFDSTISVMKIRDIPDSTKKLVFEKKSQMTTALNWRLVSIILLKAWVILRIWILAEPGNCSK